ncbi:protein HIDE1 isoform X1 [Podarcis lilfordi]|uniref:Protein HIDE1 isoform X1 n=1 Tax=Podarcis lilfordi TaxID=74358 RepID=A0AA35LI92_9SAUR|nr:protein HIDE1 isoform X1 [Podarcis lilfordi]
MLHKTMDLKILFLLLAGSWVASSLLPSPLIFLDVLSETLNEGDSIKIACLAPRQYKDALFYLFKVSHGEPLQVVHAAEAQHQVIFLLENITRSDGGQYKCQFGVYNGSALKPSEFSNLLEITVEASSLTTFPPTAQPRSDSKGPFWVLPVVLSVVGVLLLAVILLVAAIALRRFKERRKKQRVLDSCWTETSYPTTETSFDNSMYTITMKTDQETIENNGAWISSATSTRLSSRCSVEKPDFCTFRGSE